MLIKHSIIAHRKEYYVHICRENIRDGSFVNSQYATDVIMLIR